jgi:hypothetical protein
MKRETLLLLIFALVWTAAVAVGLVYHFLLAH